MNDDSMVTIKTFELFALFETVNHWSENIGRNFILYNNEQRLNSVLICTPWASYYTCGGIKKNTKTLK